MDWSSQPHMVLVYLYLQAKALSHQLLVLKQHKESSADSKWYGTISNKCVFVRGPTVWLRVCVCVCWNAHIQMGRHTEEISPLHPRS